MRFYVLDNFPRGPAETRMSCLEDYLAGDAPKCSVCERYTGSLTWLPPFRVELELIGKEFGDFAFGAGGDFLVSQRFLEIYQRNALTGLSGFEPVEVTKVKSRRRKRPDPPPYLRAVVSHSRAALDFVASDFEWLEPPTCSECKLGRVMRWKRLIIEEGTWPGEDIFIARGLSGTFLASERFKNVCDDNDVTNAIFVPAESYGHDFYPGLKDPSELNMPPR